ncbi:MAG: hypothetical protein QMC95_01515 [Desulfitobacteriaceae bacterium]|nr:hypothetical protein [Desulfitobacteriaceae bacterium]MDI6912881.1 hypothetical protein [Desulfitobacteriaceae bacterium]
MMDRWWRGEENEFKVGEFMFLNYRVEICRKCYLKRTHHCHRSDLYVQNRQFFPVKQGGECPHYIESRWFL